MPKSTVGQVLADADDDLQAIFEEPLRIRNWIEGDLGDDYGDYGRVAHPDNPIHTHGQVDHPWQPDYQQDTAGGESAVDSLIFVPEDVLISAGDATDAEGNALVFPSQVITESGRAYTVLETYLEGNGLKRCLGRDSGEVDD